MQKWEFLFFTRSEWSWVELADAFAKEKGAEGFKKLSKTDGELVTNEANEWGGGYYWGREVQIGNKDLASASMAQLLKIYGLQGWELVGTGSNTDGYFVSFVLKRPLD